MLVFKVASFVLSMTLFLVTLFPTFKPTWHFVWQAVKPVDRDVIMQPINLLLCNHWWQENFWLQPGTAVSSSSVG